jgi:hypothetical protein
MKFDQATMNSSEKRLVKNVTEKIAFFWPFSILFFKYFSYSYSISPKESVSYYFGIPLTQK